jgi:peptidoglycan/LPS O-acetylase OafA/YrhL
MSKQPHLTSGKALRITLAKRLTDASNRPSGFDYMRLLLATLVVCSHAINVCYGKDFTYAVWRGPARPLLAIILPMFFALSGFLVAGSLERCRTLVSFVGLRGLRLIPALAVDTMVGALLLGPIFTTLPLSEYFTQPAFHSYFLNITGKIHYFLPGVFANNPWPAFVNQQLWTLPFEMICYVSLAALAFFGIAQRPKLFVIVALIANALIYLADRFVFKTVFDFAFVGQLLVQCFLFGIAAYLLRRKIVWDKRLFLLSVVATFTFLALPGWDYLVPLPATYVTVFLGLLQPKRNWLLRSGDYSYGIFLYGFPVQQAVAATLGHWGERWYVNLLFALPITYALAAFSWWCVEKPALRLKPALLRLEDAVLQFTERVPAIVFLVPRLGVKGSVDTETSL